MDGAAFKQEAEQADMSPTKQLPAYRVLLHHDGQSYVAEVPELAGCKGTGISAAAALRAAENAIAAWLQSATVTGTPAPSLLAPAELAWSIRERLCGKPVVPKHGQRMSPVKLMLVEKFGKMSNRELAGRIGLSGRDAPTMLSAAASGKGTRKARCAIALALGEIPSRLWPDRPPAIGDDDDDMFYYFKEQGFDPGAELSSSKSSV